MTAPEPRNAIEGALANFQNFGDALRSSHVLVSSAADHHRQRATNFLQGLKLESQRKLARFQRAHAQGSGLSLSTNAEGGRARPRRVEGRGPRLVPAAVAAELPAAQVTAKADASATSEKAIVAPHATSASQQKEILHPTLDQLLKHPVAAFYYVPKDAALFVAGAVAGATAKTLTAPLDRWKLMLQVKSVQNPNAVQAVGSVNLLESFVQIGKEEGVLGYWRGNLPQVLRIIPYSAVQLFAYESYKKLFMGKAEKLSVPARLAAGACAGMTSTFLTYPLDVLRLRLAVEPGARHMIPVAMRILRDEGAGAFYKGLGPSLISIAPYIALNFCAFDLVKKAIPEKYQKTPQASLVTALCATTFATVMCYPLDTVRRQMQMKTSPFNSLLDAVPGIIKRDGIHGLYRGFIANALKNLPNSSIRLTTYDTAKNLLASSKAEHDRLVQERREKEGVAAPQPIQ